MALWNSHSQLIFIVFGINTLHARFILIKQSVIDYKSKHIFQFASHCIQLLRNKTCFGHPRSSVYFKKIKNIVFQNKVDPYNTFTETQVINQGRR